jgi:hypothetical protein
MSIKLAHQDDIVTVKTFAHQRTALLNATEVKFTRLV